METETRVSFGEVVRNLCKNPLFWLFLAMFLGALWNGGYTLNMKIILTPVIVVVIAVLVWLRARYE